MEPLLRELGQGVRRRHQGLLQDGVQVPRSALELLVNLDRDPPILLDGDHVVPDVPCLTQVTSAQIELL